ncbi:hypothetical protein [Synechococcus elongatus]|uniref:hypothetical protein n=1 Tax=Synechococcus elongatus TaxID=32046 RepID=UPI000F7D6DA0|nr:hypothetical protein [Synechococcus elongatus]
MQVAEISPLLIELFGADRLEANPPESWQIQTPECRLLLLLSASGEWLRVLLPLLPAVDAAPFHRQILEANFDATGPVRYALHQNVLWGVFQHDLASLTSGDLYQAIASLFDLAQRGLDPFFTALAETQLRQIVRAAKQQGQSLPATLQTLTHLYEEGVLGNLSNGPEIRRFTLDRWREQLERLWPEVEVDSWEQS